MKKLPVKTARRRRLPDVNITLKGLMEKGKVNSDTGVVKQIRVLSSKGYSRKDLVAAGYNRSTVYRQAEVV